MKVAVVGCGIGGSAAALLLSRAGHAVTVFERAPDLGPRGAGILLAPTGQYVLAELGLLGAVRKRASVVDRLEGRTSGGRLVMDLRYRNLGASFFGLGVYRGALFSILRRAMSGEGVALRTGWEVLSINDGLVRSVDGVVDGVFDLVIVADGARSHVRRSLYLETRFDPYPYGALWASVPNWGDYADNVLRQVYLGTRRMLGLLPSGVPVPGSPRQISLFWSTPLGHAPDLWGEGFGAWKREVLALCPETAPALAEIECPDQIILASYYDVRTWAMAKRGIAILGDAGHATSPQLGQGASLALLDALVLSRCLSEERDLREALDNFNRSRENHVRFYQLASKWMTPFFQSDSETLAPARDLLLPALCRIPPAQRAMLATMCGFKSGPLSSIGERKAIADWADGKLIA